MGMSGISSVTLSADCYMTDFQKSVVQNILPGTPVYFSELNFPALVLVSYNIDDHVLSITAADKLSDADITFTADGTTFTEYSGQTDANGNPIKNIYHGQAVLDACAAKLGLGSCSVSDLPDLYYSEFVGKTVREILTSISEAAVGVFYARGSLLFAPYTLGENQNRDVLEVLPEDRSEVEFLGNKNITHTYITDNVYSQTYEYGSGEWYNTLSKSGAYIIGQDVCTAVSAKIIATDYTGWKCEKAVIEILPTPNMMLNSETDNIIRECRIDFGEINIVAYLGAPAPQMNKSEFQDEKTRLISQKIEAGKAYQNVFIDENNGLTITYKEASNG